MSTLSSDTMTPGQEMIVGYDLCRVVRLSRLGVGSGCSVCALYAKCVFCRMPGPHTDLAGGHYALVRVDKIPGLVIKGIID